MGSEKREIVLRHSNRHTGALRLNISCGCVVVIRGEVVRDVYLCFGALGGIEMERKATEEHKCESSEISWPPLDEPVVSR